MEQKFNSQTQHNIRFTDVVKHVKCLRDILYMNMYIQELSISVSTIVNACDTTQVLTAKIDATSHNM